jgi:hypothetical protein
MMQYVDIYSVVCWSLLRGIPRGTNENQNLISIVKQFIIIALLFDMCVLTQ